MSGYNDFRNRLDKLTGKEKRLKILLENISDTYDDFVKGELYTAVEYGYVDKMIEYIENSSPELTTSDVSEKSCEFMGL